MDTLSLVCFQLYFAYCFRLCVSHIDIRHFKKPISSQVTVRSEHLVNGVRSMLLCASLCGRNSKCRGYRFSEDGNCYTGERLHVPTENEDLTSVPASYILQDLKVCRSVPAVQNADVTYEDNHVGAEATCICKPDFRQCGTNNKITCLTTMNWEKPSASCEQFRWENPDVTFLEPLPCGKQTKLKIVVKGTPMKETRMTFNIKRKEDILFHADFRFNMGNDRRKGIFTAYINSQWKNEARPDIFPVDLHQTFFLEMTLVNGVYKTMVNGKHLTTRPEDDIGGKPDRFEITGDLTIGKVEILY